MRVVAELRVSDGSWVESRAQLAKVLQISTVAEAGRGTEDCGATGRQQNVVEDETAFARDRAEQSALTQLTRPLSAQRKRRFPLATGVGT